jgi:hypothetical protein
MPAEIPAAFIFLPAYTKPEYKVRKDAILW